MFFLFVCLSDCKYLLFPCEITLWPECSFPHSCSIEGKSSCATHSTIFVEKNQNYFLQTLPNANSKSAKNNPHVFQTKPRKFGDTKISHYTVFGVELHEKSVLRITVLHHKAVPSDANSDPEGQIFLSMPNSLDRFLFLHNFHFSMLLITFKCRKLTNIHVIK